jgi:hypothetical protein
LLILLFNQFHSIVQNKSETKGTLEGKQNKIWAPLDNQSTFTETEMLITTQVGNRKTDKNNSKDLKIEKKRLLHLTDFRAFRASAMARLVRFAWILFFLHNNWRSLLARL